MRTTHFYPFPADRAVTIFHPDFADGSGLTALVAPSFTPGVHHVGIVEVNGQNWKFINGPARVKASRVWRKLFDAHEDWKSATSTILANTDDLSIPALSPDHLIDLITGRDY
jgi:hypothetical protein